MSFENIYKNLTKHFATPVRSRQLTKQAEKIIGITRYKIVGNFIYDLKKEGIIKSYILTAKNKKTITLYISRSIDEFSPYELALAMFPEGYFCNLSAIFYHGLTNQIPTSIYTCNETISAQKRTPTRILTQTQLRNAFIKPHRHTKYIFNKKGYEIVVVDRSKHSGDSLVPIPAQDALFPHHSRVTCLERALIDAIVSPQYNGGIVSVYGYFRNAQQKLKLSKLVEIYRKLNFLYPYSQSIGFFLEKSGMQKHASHLYKVFPPLHDFFVDHNAKTSWIYNDKWKLSYPSGLVDEN